MAIDRTAFNAWVDDDGTGTTGTVLTKARMDDDILDPIDAAIASAVSGAPQILRSTAATRPAAASVPAGSLHYGSDSGVLTRSNGSAWEEFGWVPDVGTFTPALTFGDASTGITYEPTLTRGNYLAVGPWVLFQMLLRLTNKGTATGQAKITGFPFASLVYYRQPLMLDIMSWSTVAAPVAYLQDGGVIYLYNAQASNYFAFNDTHFLNTTQIGISGIVLRAGTVPW